MALPDSSGFKATMHRMAVEQSVRMIAAVRGLKLPDDWRSRLDYRLGDAQRGMFLEQRAEMLLASLASGATHD